jgi:hypothetical protein
MPMRMIVSPSNPPGGCRRAPYQNNIAAASFITTYFTLPSSAIIACKNGEVRPSQGVLWCGHGSGIGSGV